MTDTNHPARWWHKTDDGKLQCDLCPRYCRLADGQRAFCFVRERQGDQMVLATYGRSSGFAIDPIEKKPLNHFYPGTSVLSFGTAGCNLGCKFCQNWDISKSREMDSLASFASPDAIARAAVSNGCKSVAFTYNDPTIFAEYAIDVAQACRTLGIKTVAVTAGYICKEPRAELYRNIDAVNVDLKAFTDEFYRKQTSSSLEPVKETLIYLVKEARVWTEITTLVIPGYNDSDAEIHALTSWVRDALGPEVPLHFSAFHPDYKMLDVPPTPPASLRHAREIAFGEGLRYVYVGNVHDAEADTTYCPGCKDAVIVRDWYEILASDLRDGCCGKCGAAIAGRFDASVGTFGRRRLRVAVGA